MLHGVFFAERWLAFKWCSVGFLECRIAPEDRPRRQVLECDAPCGKHRAFTHGHAGSDKSFGADPSVGPNLDRQGIDLKRRVMNIVGAGAQKCTLRHDGMRADLNRRHAITADPRAQGCPLVHGQVWWIPDARTAVQKRAIGHVPTEQTNKKYAPMVEWCGRPCRHCEKRRRGRIARRRFRRRRR